MKSYLNIKHYFVFVTTLLLVLLQPLHSFQHFFNDYIAHNHEHTVFETLDLDHDESHQEIKCAICEFTFQPYLVTDIALVPFNEVIAFNVKNTTTPPLYFYQTNFQVTLRGPPALFLV